MTIMLVVIDMDMLVYVSTPVFNILLMCAACEREGDRRTEQCGGEGGSQR